MQRPVRPPEHLPRKQYRVRLSLRDDLLRLARAGDHADGTGGDAGFLADGCGERHLIARTDDDVRARDRATARAIDQVGAELLEPAAESYALRQVPAAFSPVAGGDASEE